MTTQTVTEHAHHDAHEHDHHDTEATSVFGFWIYIMSDCVLFACLFATFAVLHANSYNGFGLKEFLDLPYVLTETVCLLASSFTYGMAILSLYRENRAQVLLWLLVTVIFGASFVVLEIKEFLHLIEVGHGPNTSATMSAFFALVGTHGLHVSLGILWMVVMIIQLFVFGVNADTKRRLTYLGMFWAFLDIVWIFVYTVVYLIGGM